MSCSRLPILVLLTLVACATTAELSITAGDDLARLPADERNAAAKLRWCAAAVTLPDGHLTLDAAIAAIAGSGNTITLGDGVDGTRSADLSGFSGDWWSAVLLLCDAFALEPAPGNDASSDAVRGRGDESGQPLVVSAGPLVLVARAPTPTRPRFACGPLLLEVYELSVTNRENGGGGWADLGLRARIEPRFPARELGRLALRWDRALAGDVATKPQFGDVDGNGTHLRLTGLPADTSRLALSGNISLATLAPLHLATTLQPGDTVAIDLGEHQLQLKLFNADQARAAGKRSPCAILTYPAAAFSSPVELTLSIDGKTVASHGSGTRQGGDGDCELTRFYADLANVAHVVDIVSAQPLGELELPFDISLDLTTALPTTPLSSDASDAADVASSVTLPGGELALSDAVRLLRASGNEVLVNLGVDTHAKATLPAARLGFWDATLVVTEAFNLELMPSLQGMDTNAQGRNRRNGGVRDDGNGESLPLLGGSLGLSKPQTDDRPLSRAACGPLLVEVARIERTERRTLAGTARLANVQLRFRLEPRVAPDLVSDARLVWASAASDGAGNRLAVGPVDGDGQPPKIEEGPGTLIAVQVSGLSPTSRHFTLAGQVLLHLQRLVRCEAVLELSGPVVVARLGSLPVSLSLVEGEQTGVQLNYANNRLGNDLQVVVRGPDGIELAQRGRSSHGNGRRQSDTWLLAGLQAGTHYTVTIATRETLAAPVIAVALPVELP